MSPAKRGVWRGRTPFEIAVLVFSLAATGAVVAGLVAFGVTSGPDVADLRVTVRETGVRASGGAVFEVTVRNVGDKTAENVVVEVLAGDESRELELLSVSKRDEETATVIFPVGTTGPASARVLSYHETIRG
jgi:uncharacterized protein (TIGR02588 family)